MSGEIDTGPAAVPEAACEICRTIPDRVSNTTKGDETWGDPLPPAVGRLLVVGAPVYDTDTSHSNRALHKCPLCGTFYWWEFEYEYLAGGSEDSTVFTRLDPEAGARLERDCLDHVAAALERDRVEAAEHAAALVASTDDETILAASSFAFWSRQRGFAVDLDLSGALPALVDRLVRLPKEGGRAVLRSDLPDLLLRWVGESRERAQDVLRHVRSCNVAEPSPEAGALAARCGEILAKEAKE